MSKALIPGSFDPVTTGHLDLIERAAAIFDIVFVVIFENSVKKPLFETAVRLEMLRRACKHLPNIQTDVSRELVARYAQAYGITALVKGVRNTVDFEYECDIAQVNRSLFPPLDTVFLPSKPEHRHISSTVVRELVKYRCSFDGYVPNEIIELLKENMP